METPNHSGLPIIEIPVTHHERIADVGRLLFERGVYVTLAAYPLVPKSEVGFRIQVTAANTDAEIDRLIEALEELAARGELRRATAASTEAGRLSVSPGGAHPRSSPAPALWRPTSRSARCDHAAYAFVPPFAGSGPVMNAARPLAGHRDPRRAAASTGRRRLGRGCSSRSASRSSSSATSTPTATRDCSGKEVPFPSPRRRRLHRGVPGADGRPARARPPPQPALRPRRRDRLADHHARPGAAVVVVPDRALPARRRADAVAKLVSIAYPLGDILLLAAAIRLAVDTGKRQPAFYLLASSIVALLVTDAALRPGTAERDLQQRRLLRRRLDQLLPAVGRRRAAPVDARARRGRAGARRAASAASAWRC